ncbi:hypothetical protein [Acidisphaera sp. L21]|uniref:hypothetical protein n=1 Tax=Acidisphaera sp. L21 TaxID=1641851 RepID=UPI00131BD7FE|nr:hypothetical protein [Acidisphaera sp. L21]
MEYPVITRRAATVPLEIAHRGVDGVLHGHSLTAEVWTAAAVDLDDWRRAVTAVAAEIEGMLEETIRARTFEDVAEIFLDRLPKSDRVIIRLPTRGHAVEAVRE